MYRPDDLQKFMTEQKIVARLIRNIGDTPTVPAAAAALGVSTEQIVKTLLFLVRLPGAEEPQPVVVISNGESRVDKGPLAKHFGVGKKKNQAGTSRGRDRASWLCAGRRTALWSSHAVARNYGYRRRSDGYTERRCDLRGRWR